jgi:hypothetical protein
MHSPNKEAHARLVFSGLSVETKQKNARNKITLDSLQHELQHGRCTTLDVTVTEDEDAD